MNTKQNNELMDAGALVKWVLCWLGLWLALYAIGFFITMEVMKWLYVAAVPAMMIHFVLVLRQAAGR